MLPAAAVPPGAGMAPALLSFRDVNEAPGTGEQAVMS
jgi:hypothetical protein